MNMIHFEGFYTLISIEIKIQIKIIHFYTVKKKDVLATPEAYYLIYTNFETQFMNITIQKVGSVSFFKRFCLL